MHREICLELSATTPVLPTHLLSLAFVSRAVARHTEFVQFTVEIP